MQDGPTRLRKEMLAAAGVLWVRRWFAQVMITPTPSLPPYSS